MTPRDRTQSREVITRKDAKTPRTRNMFFALFAASRETVCAALRETAWRLGMGMRLQRVAVLVAVALGVAPATGLAQTDPVFDSLLPLYRAATGAYGDEGPRLTTAVNALAAAVARDDAALREAESTLEAQLRGATPEAALQAHTLLASMYLEHGRLADALREFDQDLLIDPKRAAFHRFKGSIYEALGRRAEAADACHAAWAEDPADPQNAYHLIVYPSERTTAAERAQARLTLTTLERAVVQAQRAKAESPFL